MEFEYQIGHLRVENPIGNAGGIARKPEDVQKLAQAALGWIEVGSYTLEKRSFYDIQSQNPWHYDGQTRIATNAYRMQNQGFDAVEKEDAPTILEIAHNARKPVIMNVALVSDNPVEEACELVERAWLTGVDAVLVNPACPSLKKGTKLSYDFERVQEIKSAIKPITKRFKPIFFRPSPAASYADMRRLIKNLSSPMSESPVFSAIFASNSWEPTQTEREKIGFQPGMGGKSGAGMRNEARKQTSWARTASFYCRTPMDVVSSVGLDSGAEAAFRIHKLGARACAMSTPFMLNMNWAELVDKFNRDYLDKLTEYQDPSSCSAAHAIW
jgi:dihydroorotate dehydrogenase